MGNVPIVNDIRGSTSLNICHVAQQNNQLNDVETC